MLTREGDRGAGTPWALPPQASPPGSPFVGVFIALRQRAFYRGRIKWRFFWWRDPTVDSEFPPGNFGLTPRRQCFFETNAVCTSRGDVSINSTITFQCRCGDRPVDQHSFSAVLCKPGKDIGWGTCNRKEWHRAHPPFCSDSRNLK